MKLRTLLSSLCLFTACAHGAMDVTPRWIDTFIDGIVVHQLYFTDGKQKYLLRVNRETQVSPGSGGSIFTFKKFPEITFIVATSPRKPKDLFEAGVLDSYRAAAKGLLPLNGRFVAFKEELADPLPINNWRSYRILISYETATGPYLQSTTFLNLTDEDQVVLITTAPEAQWDEAATRSFQIIRSWQEMLPGDERPPGSN